MYFAKKLNNFKNIKHCFFSKNGGASSGIYNSLNCGLGSNDSKEKILKNLEIVSKEFNSSVDNLVLMNQAHSNKVIVIDQKNKHIKRFKSDALITKIKNIPISVLTADCVPILIFEELNKIIACIHAGWKGTFNGIIENTINKITSMSPKNNIYAAVGPCIGKNSYEVKFEFYKKFIENDVNNKVFFYKKNEDKFLFDLRAYVNNKLKKLNIHNLDNIEMDTYVEKENFFSFRRSVHLNEKDYGRCISTICLKT